MRDHPAYLAETLVALLGTGNLNDALNGVTPPQRAALGALAEATLPMPPRERRPGPHKLKPLDLTVVPSCTPDVARRFVHQLGKEGRITTDRADFLLEQLEDIFLRFSATNLVRVPTSNDGARGEAGGKSRPKTKLVVADDPDALEHRLRDEAEHRARIEREVQNGHLERTLQALVNITQLILIRELALDTSVASLWKSIVQAVETCAEARGVEFMKSPPKERASPPPKKRGRPTGPIEELRQELTQMLVSLPSQMGHAVSAFPLDETMKEVELSIGSADEGAAAERVRASSKRAGRLATKKQPRG